MRQQEHRDEGRGGQLSLLAFDDRVCRRPSTQTNYDLIDCGGGTGNATYAVACHSGKRAIGFEMHSVQERGKHTCRRNSAVDIHSCPK